MRWVSHLTGVSVATAGPWLTAGFGLVGVVLIALYAAQLFDTATGQRAADLFSFFPGSFVLIMAYSEGLVIAASAGCLLALHRRAWWAAGLCAAVATATRPTALALVPACLVAALLAMRARREWQALVAPALAPLGAVAFFGWLAGGGGSVTRWYQVEKAIWQEHLSVSVLATRFRDAFDAPLLNLNAMDAAVGSIVLVLAVVVVLRAKQPAADTVYVVLVALSFELSYTIGARPRMLLVVVPAFIAIARASGRWWTLLIAVTAALLPLTAALSWLTLLQTP